MRAKRGGALAAHRGCGFLDGPGSDLRANHAGCDGDSGDTHRLQLHGLLLDARRTIERGWQHRQGKPRREQHGGHAGHAGRLGAADGYHEDSVGRGGDAEHAYPVGAGQAGVREPDVQYLGEQRVGIEYLGNAGVGAAG
ncbi:MAG TPA: hypothetical protein VN969_35785 [Streptosporangiaceae bacterium]|nr:hypothetical protein [Streptosporangiaceae bacterium]